MQCRLKISIICLAGEEQSATYLIVLSTSGLRSHGSSLLEFSGRIVKKFPFYKKLHTRVLSVPYSGKLPIEKIMFFVDCFDKIILNEFERNIWQIIMKLWMTLLRDSKYYIITRSGRLQSLHLQCKELCHFGALFVCFSILLNGTYMEVLRRLWNNNFVSTVML